MATALSGPDQYALTFERATHSVLGTANTRDGRRCGLEVLMSWLDSPGQSPDTTCMELLEAADPSLARADLRSLNQAVFGVDDPWTLVP